MILSEEHLSTIENGSKSKLNLEDVTKETLSITNFLVSEITQKWELMINSNESNNDIGKIKETLKKGFILANTLKQTIYLEINWIYFEIFDMDIPEGENPEGFFYDDDIEDLLFKHDLL